MGAPECQTLENAPKEPKGTKGVPGGDAPKEIAFTRAF
jgi:hypothetical protein